MPNNSKLDLGTFSQGQTTQEPQKQPVDPTEQFDVTRKARQESLKTVTQLLNAAEGAKLTRKQNMKAIAALHAYCKQTDFMITALVKDLFLVVRAVAQGEVNTFAVRTNLKTVVRALESKGLVTEEELRAIHDKEVLPGELPPGTSPEQVAELKEKKLKAAEKEEKAD